MTVQPNGTDAKDIALHFINATVGRATPSIIKRTIVQAKTLLSSSYTKEEIIKVIDYIIDVKKVEMYSFGYVSVVINDILKEINAVEVKAIAKEQKALLQEEMKTAHIETRGEVKDSGESSERNRNKVSRFGITTKQDFSDLFKDK